MLHSFSWFCSQYALLPVGSTAVHKQRFLCSALPFHRLLFLIDHKYKIFSLCFKNRIEMALFSRFLVYLHEARRTDNFFNRWTTNEFQWSTKAIDADAYADAISYAWSSA